MAYLATVASHAVNGVAALHSRLLRQTVLRDFADLYPERFTNVTNGITPRRFLGLANPTLSALITDAIGEGWLGDLPRIADLERFAFVPDFNVKTGQRIYPAADLSLQISTAGMEASGTGNMKFALSGALTIGTLDGANVEIREAVGAENFFLFGLTADEVEARRRAGWNPRSQLDRDPELAEILADLAGDRWSPGEAGLFAPIVDSLLTSDPFFVLADFRSYVDCQERATVASRDVESWTRASILNAARCGGFGSDRSIREYADRIWKVAPVELGD